MVRIVHTGDMHLDSPFKGLPRGVAQLRKEEQRETFLRLMEETKAYHADILLIAGDLFDSRYVSGETVAFLKEAFSRIPETAVFVAPGNHDFLAEDSRYRTEDFDTLTVQSIYPARALSLLEKESRRLTGMTTDVMAGLKYVAMADAATLRMHAQGTEALYVLTTPLAESGVIDQWTNALQLYRPDAE